jgi:hypothetical protein
MIILGKTIHRKYIKVIAVILCLFISVILMSCNKLEFDPTTSTLKYMLKEKKNEQSIK